MQFHSESLSLSLSSSKTCDPVFNWDTQRYGELSDHTHVAAHVESKVRVMLDIKQMLNLVRKGKNPVLPTNIYYILIGISR